MPATSIKLPPELKKRIDALIANSDQTARAFMVAAIARETERAVLRKRFHGEVREAEADVLTTGKCYDAREVFDYLSEKLRGWKVTKPRPRKWPPSS